MVDKTDRIESSTLTLKTHNHRDPDVQLRGGGNYALSNDITSHNATEDVNKNGVHFGIGGDQAEGFIDLTSSGCTTDVEEVGWGTTVKLDDVHGCHGQTGSVH